MDFLPEALEPLRAYSQFVIYEIAPSKTRPGKTDKYPIHPQNKARVDGTDSVFWMDADEAIKNRPIGNQFGVGFILSEKDPFFLVDLDRCLEDETTNPRWSDLANSMVSAFAGAAVEISCSGRGLHIIGKGKAEPHRCKSPIVDGLEFYSKNRLIALTGTQAFGSANLDCSNVLEWLTKYYFPPIPSKSDFEWSVLGCPEWNGPIDDNDLLNRALRTSAKKSFSGDLTFADLWDANIPALIKAFPDPQRDHQYDASSADASLAQHLCFWTGNNCERIRSLMLQSKLVRDKWYRGDMYSTNPQGVDYLPLTIMTAVLRQTEWLNDDELEVTTPTPSLNLPSLTTRNGATFLNYENQIKLFQGCVYVEDEHRILVPGGRLLKPEQFNVKFGGYTFPMDLANERRPTRKAWECFTESQILSNQTVYADSTSFRPDLPPGKIDIEEDERLVNSYWPIAMPKKQGEPTPILEHLLKILPDDKDRLILISYMAACVQYKGVKFVWAPFIQGMPGNGKSLLVVCLTNALGRRYTHIPTVQNLTEKYNSWLYQRLFIGVNDAQTSYFSDEFIETLKTWITDKYLEIRMMNINKMMKRVCCNFMITSNFKDGIRKNNTERRFAPFFCAQQNSGDLARDGMIDDYFPNLWSWLYNGGFAIFNNFLENFKIPDKYNPLNQKPAPITSCTSESISYSLSAVEQEILECIEQGLPGYKGGWISSIQIGKLLERLKADRRIPPQKRQELLFPLGYILHPGLTNGRTNNPVKPDMIKARLFIRSDHPDLSIVGAAKIEKAYCDAQT